MGLYNPHFPHIIGEEWVPIRNENLQFSPSVSAVEIGYQFDHFNSSDVATNARYYLNEWAHRVDSTVVSTFITQSFFAALYEAGTEADTGPIQVIRVPVMGAVSSGIIIAGLANSTTYQQALAQPNDGKFVFMNATALGPLFSALDMYFSVRQFDALLWNKRIVAIDIVYNAAVTFGAEPNSTFLGVGVGTSIDYGQATFNELGVMHVGDTNWFFATDHAGLASPTPHPWTPTSVRRFDQNDANSIRIRFQTDSNADVVENQTFELYYVAMDIYYCEEKRIAMGGGVHLLQGMNQTTMYTPTEPASAGITLNNKAYTFTLSAADTGDTRGLTGTGTILAQPYPSLNAIRQLYENPFHPGIQINHPAPVGPNIVGKTFTKEHTDVLPQLTLHKSSGTPDIIGDVHAYGRQVGAQVYGTAIAEQTIEDANVGNVTTQQVRYYARRFGNTTSALDLVRTSASSTVIASLTPTEWDALEPENGILDGWKEVTLALDTPQTFTGTRPSFRWQSTNELAGDRWEILAMIAPSISGTPLNQYTPTTPSYQLGIATYGWPVSGASDALRWLQVPLSQGVSAVPAVVDPTADAVLMFAVSPPAVTGISLSELSQSLSAVISDCIDCDPCVPTSLKYNKLSWDMGVTDTFTRSAVSGWGSADTGGAWTRQLGPAYQLEVNGTKGIVNIVNATGSPDWSVTQSKAITDVEVTADLLMTAAVSGSSLLSAALLARFVDSNNNYQARLSFNAATVDMSIGKTVASVSTTLITYVNAMTYGPDVQLQLVFNVTGNTLKFTLNKLDSERNIIDSRMFYTTDTGLTSAGGTGVFVGTGSGLNVPMPVYWDNFCAYPSPLGDGGFYELQRMDTLTDWQTIMRGSPCSWYMNDYEARVGILSTYRMRIVDALNFAGPWSSSSTNTLTSPGVSGGSCIDGVGVLIFTTNAAQDGRYNLAYVQTWERDVQEDFSFPEAGTVSLNRVYQRDFAVAFKGTERGGEQFSRSILVSNAAVAPERLANISSLRDMAWADVPYICVRDEIGDRWFALVQVPAESVRRNRQLYLAAIAVSEVTDTAYPIDPVVNT